ncbi:MAG: 50S ribosomal protein L16 [Candidatus Dependentiae bacterium]|jgi:large subunit ribosomal protein L16|nr:50S ribosomal protein L16 [Candidatus Dependentiae bacterium]
MLMPKKVKFRKSHRGRMTGISKGARTVAFGEFGLEAVEPVWLTAQQIESVRVTVARRIKKVGKFFLRVFPDKPVSKKPIETRMGKGKGNPEFWVAVVKRGRVICELGDVDEATAKEIFRMASYKLPMKTKFVRKEV